MDKHLLSGSAGIYRPAFEPKQPLTSDGFYITGEDGWSDRRSARSAEAPSCVKTKLFRGRTVVGVWRVGGENREKYSGDFALC